MSSLLKRSSEVEVVLLGVTGFKSGVAKDFGPNLDQFNLNKNKGTNSNKGIAFSTSDSCCNGILSFVIWFPDMSILVFQCQAGVHIRSFCHIHTIDFHFNFGFWNWWWLILALGWTRSLPSKIIMQVSFRTFAPITLITKNESTEQ